MKNYYCNDEIDRDTCPLYYNKEEGTYKIGKRTIPTLENIVSSVIGIQPRNFRRKDAIINSLRSFLLNGIKTKEGDASLLEKVDEKKTYKVFNFQLENSLEKENNEYTGFYKNNVDETLKNMFSYNKKLTKTELELLKGFDDFTKVIMPLEKELKNNVENADHLEEIAELENIFINKIENRYERINQKTILRQNKAWFSLFEIVGQKIYHLAKKSSKKEDIFYASQIDIATKDTLYYIETENTHSIYFIILFLNILNIDLKKEHLKVIFSFSSGTLEETIEVPKLSNEFLDEAIQAYKNKNLIDTKKFPNFTSCYHKGEVYTTLRQPFFYFYNYVYSLLPYEVDLGFSLKSFITSSNISYSYDSLKDEKRVVVYNLILALKIIKEIIKTSGVEYAMMAKDKIAELCYSRTEDKTKYLESLLFEEHSLKAFIRFYKNSTLQLAAAYKSEMEFIDGLNMQKVNYQDVTLDLKISPEQKNILLRHLNVNLLTIPNLNQIVNIKERKKLTTLKGDEVNIAKTYKKNGRYTGAIKASEYLNVVIKNVDIIKNYNEENKANVLLVNLTTTSKNIALSYTIYENPSTKEEKEAREKTNKLLTLFFDTFSIQRGCFNFDVWIGKEAKIAVDDGYDDNFQVALSEGVLYVCKDELNKEWGAI